MLLSSFKKNILGIFIFFALFTANVSATIVSKGDYTQDDKTSLDWLKVTKTQGQSYNEILRRLAVGGDLNGWRFATQDELVTLVINWLGHVPRKGAHVENNGIGKLVNYMGETEVKRDYFEVFSGAYFEVISSTYGYVEVDFDEDSTVRAIYLGEWTYENKGKEIYENKGIVSQSYKARTKRRYNIGAFLVRTSAVTTVSEPASLGLFGLGLIGIAAFSRPRRLS